MLHSLAMKYQNRETLTKQILDTAMKMKSRGLIDEALVSTKHNVKTWWNGIRLSFDQAGFIIDAKGIVSAITTIDAHSQERTLEKKIDHMMIAGYEESYQENRVFEDSMFWVNGLSAVKAIQILKALKVPILELKPPQRYMNPGISDVIVSDINNALNMGWTVITPMESGGLPAFPYYHPCHPKLQIDQLLLLQTTLLSLPLFPIHCIFSQRN